MPFVKFDIPLRRRSSSARVRRASGDSFADLYAGDPDGVSDIFLRKVPHSVLAMAERRGQEEGGLTPHEWIRRVLAQIERDGRFS